ncbi:alkaline phosphatase family protein [Luteolibacter arcticus]|uniref:Alkaline phosphatase family protein n=1 Tax=Luteolibacter arcticus TaxID=1581411 RepID=A0ABT3GRJ4_9BACT|nr:alkaline phosphatase family protein [Luteolibacter arcticus]MCW1926120.1 alkaline phosphatase family protein [Luteolibacter arcticus]
MNTPLRSTAIALMALVSPVFAAGPGAGNDFAGKRVLIIGIDGLRPDAMIAANTPNIDALIAQGVVTHNAYAGGVLGTSTQQPTISGPGWGSITIGVWTDKHKIVDNGFAAYKNSVSTNYPHFFKRIKAAKPNSYLSSIVSWGAIEDYLVSKVASSVNYHVKATGASYPDRDLDVKNKAVAHLATANPDVLFLHFDQVDGAGHSTGFNISNSSYINAIQAVDGHIGSVMAAINARPQAAQEKWLVLLTSDHGGSSTSHGGQSDGERTISMLVSGGSVNAPHLSTESPGQTAVPPTTMKYLGLPVTGSWGWASPPFGLPPYFFAATTGNSVDLDWVLPAGGLPGLTGYQIRRNGVLIASPATGVTTFTDTPGVGTHAYEITFVGASEIRSATASVAGNLNDQLVLHLPFDSSAQDASGNGNHGTINGSPSYVAGKSSQCLQFTDTTSPHQYVSLGQPAALQFGATDSFTVSVWVNHSGTFPDNRPTGSANDPAILSNKDWNSGTNTGWFIGAGPDGRWQWNAGDGTDRADYDGPASQLSDGNWHQLCVVHDRSTNLARLFYDGSLVATRSLSAIGSLDAAKPTAVATDGTFGTIWPNWFTGKIDEVKIWRRALLDSEVSTVFQQ